MKNSRTQPHQAEQLASFFLRQPFFSRCTYVHDLVVFYVSTIFGCLLFSFFRDAHVYRFWRSWVKKMVLLAMLSCNCAGSEAGICSVLIGFGAKLYPSWWEKWHLSPAPGQELALERTCWKNLFAIGLKYANDILVPSAVQYNNPR